MKRRSRGFTLVELLVVIGIIAVLIGVLLPVLGSARRSAASVACKANLHGIGQSLLLYINDNQQHVPHADPYPWVPLYYYSTPPNGPWPSLATVLVRYTSANAWRCPADHITQITGPPTTIDNYFQRDGLSYMYNVLFDPVVIGTIDADGNFTSPDNIWETFKQKCDSILEGRRGASSASTDVTKLWVVQDQENFHKDGSGLHGTNYLYADWHAANR